MTIILFFIAFALIGSSLTVALMRRWALANAVLDIPNERSSHSQPVPRGGGVGITLIIILAAFFLPLVAMGWRWSDSAVFVAGTLCVALISWIDDLRSQPTLVRLTFHVAAAIGAVAWFGAFDELVVDQIFSISFGSAGAVLSVIWIIGLINAYNFMDGIDGIAGLQGLIAAAAWAGMGQMRGDLAVVLLSGVVTAGCAGFLMHNWPPAKIFMGDIGSAVLGFLFAILPVISVRSAEVHSLDVSAVLVVWPFLFDSIFTFCRRVLRRENLFQAHRSHLYQRLVISGVSHRDVTLLYGALALVGVVTAIALQVESAAALPLLAAVPLLAITLVLAVSVMEKRPATRP